MAGGDAGALREAWASGQRAGAAGDQATACPYGAGTPERTLWLRGLVEGRLAAATGT